MFIHHCEKLKQKKHSGWFMQVPHYFLDQHCMMYVAALCTPSELQFVLHRQMKRKEKDITKLKAASHSETQNVMSSTYIDGFTVNKTTHDICNYQNKKEKI
jgi:hypothetical protein